MKIHEMLYTTVEQVLNLRQAAIEIEQKLATLNENALSAERVEKNLLANIEELEKELAEANARNAKLVETLVALGYT